MTRFNVGLAMVDLPDTTLWTSIVECFAYIDKQDSYSRSTMDIGGFHFVRPSTCQLSDCLWQLLEDACCIKDVVGRVVVENVVIQILLFPAAPPIFDILS